MPRAFRSAQKRRRARPCTSPRLTAKAQNGFARGQEGIGKSDASRERQERRLPDTVAKQAVPLKTKLQARAAGGLWRENRKYFQCAANAVTEALNKSPLPVGTGIYTKPTSPFEKGGSRGIYLNNLPRPPLFQRGGHDEASEMGELPDGKPLHLRREKLWRYLCPEGEEVSWT
jgi:hypothetical protein